MKRSKISKNHIPKKSYVTGEVSIVNRSELNIQTLFFLGKIMKDNINNRSIVLHSKKHVHFTAHVTATNAFINHKENGINIKKEEQFEKCTVGIN